MGPLMKKFLINFAKICRKTRTVWDLLGQLDSLICTQMVTFQQLRNEVRAHMSGGAYASMLEYVRLNRPRLWGAEQPRTFLESTMLYTIYMDMKKIGVNSLIEELRLDFNLSNRSVWHNPKMMRRVLEWIDKRNFPKGVD